MIQFTYPNAERDIADFRMLDVNDDTIEYILLERQHRFEERKLA